MEVPGQLTSTYQASGTRELLSVREEYADIKKGSVLHCSVRAHTGGSQRTPHCQKIGYQDPEGSRIPAETETEEGGASEAGLDLRS
jgi:hypothetical protein